MGTITGALAVLDHLKIQYDLRLDAHTTPGQSQIRGASGLAAKRILAQFGETRPLLHEGGRTNRGLRGDIGALLTELGSARLDQVPQAERNDILGDLQGELVDVVIAFHSQQRLKLIYDPARTTWHSIRTLLDLAAETTKEGPVAQYLVGAKLQVRFPEVVIENLSSSTADLQLARVGDFLVGNTAFHVTIAPNQGHWEKCKGNLDHGYRVQLLVPERILQAAQQNADLTAPSRIAVTSIESFVAQNIDELAKFSQQDVREAFRDLLETYNKRVDDVEADKSMMVEIPPNL